MPTECDCPHCGASSKVEDRDRGKIVPCQRCGEPIETLLCRGHGWQRLVPKVILGALVVFLFVGGLLPAIQQIRSPGPRRGCHSNLRQIGIALQNYHAHHKRFPPAYTVDEHGNRLHRRRTLILPFMEQQSTYDMFDMNEPWDSPRNARAATTLIATYMCPVKHRSHDDRADLLKTNYVMIVGAKTISPGETGRSVNEIADGASKTLLIVEVAGAETPWAEPRDLSADKLAGGISGPHAEGAWALFADGSVSFLDDSLTPQTIKALSTIAGGEDVPWPPK